MQKGRCRIPPGGGERDRERPPRARAPREVILPRAREPTAAGRVSVSGVSVATAGGSGVRRAASRGVRRRDACRVHVIFGRMNDGRTTGSAYCLSDFVDPDGADERVIVRRYSGLYTVALWKELTYRRSSCRGYEELQPYASNRESCFAQLRCTT